MYALIKTTADAYPVVLAAQKPDVTVLQYEADQTVHAVHTSFTPNDGLDGLNDKEHIHRPETPPRLSDIATWSAETTTEAREGGAEYATTYNQEGIKRQLLDEARRAKQGTHLLTAFVRKAHTELSPATYKATRSMNPQITGSQTHYKPFKYM